MNLEDKFLHLYHIIKGMEQPKKPKLLPAYTELKEIFNQTFFSESLLETLDKIKNNLVYKEFKLENDSEFLKPF